MATFTVTTTTDMVDPNDGVLSLREAVNQANATAAADTIVFASALEGQTLTLTGGELVLQQDVTIDGDQNNDGIEVTLSGGDAQRILRTSGTGTDVALRDLSLENGRRWADGGAVFVGGGGLNVTAAQFATAQSGDATADGGWRHLCDAGSRVVIEQQFTYDN